MALPTVLGEAIAAYDAWTDAQLQLAQTSNRIETTLYHYTSAAGLKGILESESVWFTDYRHLNDPSEVIHGIDMSHDVIRDLKTGNDGRVGLFLDMLADLMSPANFSRALDYFIGSFSRARDDLGQWRAYADNGRGYAIGLSPRLFQIENTTDMRPDEAAFVGPVMYDIGAVCTRHGIAIEKAMTIFLEMANAHDGLMRDKTVGIPFMEGLAKAVIASPLIWNCLTSKHPAYAHEQEVRLIILGLHEKLKPYIKTRVRGSEIVPYIPHKMPIRARHSIGKVVVGPAADPDAERTVRTLLESLGVDAAVPISRSDIPYRAM
jgi:hypothetical protein